jgi:spore maturation protein CgeB
MRSLWNQQSWLQRQITNRTESGKFVNRLNEGLIKLARETRPEFVWFDKQEYVRPETMAELKKLGAKLIYYTPDPYFTLKWKRTKLMDACMALFDLVVTSKTYELEHFSTIGPQHMYLPLGYCDEVHRPMPVDDSQRVTLGFIGGWEPRRQAIIETIVSHGVSARVWGYAWDHLIDGKWSIRRYMRLRRLAGSDSWSLSKSELLADRIVSGEVYGNDYSTAISSADINLGFLRTICLDQHTTRSFEIPACGSMLLADRTAEHQEFFEEGLEADYFSSEEELIDKANFYSKNIAARRKIAENGLRRTRSSGYSYVDRMKSVLEVAGDL